MTTPGVRRLAARLGLAPERIADVVPAPSRRGDELALCAVCRAAYWDDPRWRMVSRVLAMPQGDDRLHRKVFEWVQCVYGFERLGALVPGAVALGVAAGHECVAYHLANTCRLSVATDLYRGWFTDSPGAEADPGFLADPDRYALFPYRRDHLRALPADALRLPFADGSIDVVYSLSSIEHFGGHDHALEAMREMARVLRPGGYCCVATELVLAGGGHPEYFTRPQLEAAVLHGHGMVLVEEVDWTPPERAYLDDPVHIPEEMYRTPHLVLAAGDLRWTSIVLFFRKPHPGELWRYAGRSVARQARRVGARLGARRSGAQARPRP